jgi:hypothetical protein
MRKRSGNKFVQHIVVVLVFSSLVCIGIASNFAIAGAATKYAVTPDDYGIRIIFYDAEFYFNATNGGEITEYYDLTVDPRRSRNLVNISIPGDLMGNLWPLFTSALYSPYVHSVYTTGGDPNAKIDIVDETNDRIILFTTSRMMNRDGSIVNDSDGFAVHLNTTWVFDKKTGLIFVERTLSTPTTLDLPAGWRWYPFYFTRNKGFDYNGTFYMFNTRSAKTVIVNDEIYENSYDLFPILPDDPNGVFGIAMPFTNTSIEGDGTHNVVIIYNYKELVDVSEWKSDTYNGKKYSITECGAVHEFNTAYNIFTHTYHVVIHFTHQPVNEHNVIKYANWVDLQFPLLEVRLTADNDTYHPGDPYIISALGISHHNLSNLISKFTAANDSSIYFEKEYGPHNYRKGETFSMVLFSGHIPITESPGNRTFTIQILSPTGAIIASDSKTVSILS